MRADVDPADFHKLFAERKQGMFYSQQVTDQIKPSKWFGVKTIHTN
ncbi:hypothetical protein ACFOG5_13370 [Pedobacter fastidiosus]